MSTCVFGLTETSGAVIAGSLAALAKSGSVKEARFSRVMGIAPGTVKIMVLTGRLVARAANALVTCFSFQGQSLVHLYIHILFPRGKGGGKLYQRCAREIYVNQWFTRNDMSSKSFSV